LDLNAIDVDGMLLVNGQNGHAQEQVGAADDAADNDDSEDDEKEEEGGAEGAATGGEILRKPLTEI
jgi:methionyl aminopeptidase